MRSSTRLTNQEFLDRLHKVHGYKIKPLQLYKKSQINILCKCEQCGNIWKTTPNKLLSGEGCPICKHRIAGSHLRLTDRTFRQRLRKIYGHKIIALQKYKGTRYKIWMKCTKCNHRWKDYPDHLYEGQGCPNCKNGKQKSLPSMNKHNFMKILRITHGNTITPLEKYQNANIKILFKCNKCGHIWKARPSNLERTGCPKCGAKRTGAKDRISNSKFLRELHARHGHQIIPLQKYIDSQTPILFKCTKCGHVWKNTPHDIRKRGCPICNVKKSRTELRLTNHEFLNELHQVHSDNITPLEPYVNGKIKILCRCNNCGLKWRARANSLLRGSGCPRCNKIKNSKGECVINHWLKQNFSKSFKYGYVIPKLGLHFDFWIPSQELAIEFDGAQHFRYVPYFCRHNPKHFKKAVERDRRKNNYCIRHHITLIRIQNFHNNVNYHRMHYNIYHILSRVFSAYRHHHLHAHIYRFDVNHHGRLLHNLKKNANNHCHLRQTRNMLKWI